MSVVNVPQIGHLTSLSNPLSYFFALCFSIASRHSEIVPIFLYPAHSSIIFPIVPKRWIMHLRLFMWFISSGPHNPLYSLNSSTVPFSLYRSSSTRMLLRTSDSPSLFLQMPQVSVNLLTQLWQLWFKEHSLHSIGFWHKAAFELHFHPLSILPPFPAWHVLPAEGDL